MVLFGDLTLDATIGFNTSLPPRFITDTIYCYVAANTIHFQETSKYLSNHNDSSAEQIPPHFMVSEPIVALATSPSLGLLAYAERNHKAIKILTWPDLQPYEVHSLHIPESNTSIDVLQIYFSTNDKYLIGVMDLPSFQLFVWEVKTGELLCQSPQNSPITTLSFNPFNERQFCTQSTEDGTLDFWEIEAGHRKYMLRHLAGRSFKRKDGDLPSAEEFEEEMGQQLMIKSHRWCFKNGVLAATMDGQLTLFDPSHAKFSLLTVPENQVLDLAVSVIMENRLLLGLKDGTIQEFKVDETQLTAGMAYPSLEDKSEIRHMFFNPSKTELLVTTLSGRIHFHELGTPGWHKIMEAHVGQINVVASSKIGGLFATGGSDRTVRVWDVNSTSADFCFSVHAPVTALEFSPWSPILVVGAESGEILIYDMQDEPRLLHQSRLHGAAVRQIVFDDEGKYFATWADVHGVIVSDAIETFRAVAAFDVEGEVSGLSWKFREMKENETTVGGVPGLYILAHSQNESTLTFYEMPDELVDSHLYSGDDLKGAIFVVDEPLYGLEITDNISGRETVISFSQDRTLKFFMLPSAIAAAAEARQRIKLDMCLQQFRDHDLSNCKLRLCHNRDLILTYAADGCVVVRSIAEPERAVSITAHDPYTNGVVSADMERDGRVIYSVGGDGIIRTYEWNYNAMGKKVANGFTLEFEAQREDQAPLIEKLKKKIDELPTLTYSDKIRSNEPFSLPKINEEEAEEDDEADRERVEAQSTFERNLEALKVRVNQLIEKNEKASELEKLPSDAFVIDLAEKQRLEEESLEKIKQVQKELLRKNTKDKVLFDRFKAEFWDCMEVVGKSIISFNPDSLTGGFIEITNYPLLKRVPEEITLVEKIKLRRKIQKNVNSTIKQLNDQNNTDLTEESPLVGEGSLISVDSNHEVSKLLYQPFELTTSERRITQATLLRELIRHTKTEFNNCFQEKARQKQDEITKIEDKNERIREILEELQIEEKIFSPMIHEAEAPERVLEVKDHEISIEKYVSPEELQQQEEARKAEEERMKANQDDSHERALNDMMGGRLEDRTEEEQREDIFAPVCIGKPKSELTEEEKKLIKEYEQKIQAQKDEQEKRRKALETELRKLQVHVHDLSRNFDQSLKAFMIKKQEAEQKIFHEDDDRKEKEILEKMDRLKEEKLQCMKEIPEIKSELEIYRDNYETAVKHDREVERHCRKELAAFDFFNDALMKLFRNRDPPTEQEQEKEKTSSDAIFEMSEQTRPLYRALVFEKDAIEGLPREAWDKMMVFREKKIDTEQEVENALASFTELQNLVTAVLENSERIRLETEDVTRAMNDFMEYKFHATYNPRHLFQLKQGQVEVPQAPVVTDYSDCVLINRNEVENLNEVIISLGNAKVEALTEMKNYRKGIHALEWENKVVDFQAEDLVIRTRDIQLLKVTKEMQEYLQSGDKHRANSEVAALERRFDFNAKIFRQRMIEKKSNFQKLASKIAERQTENNDLDAQLKSLESSINERQKIINVQLKHKGAEASRKQYQTMMRRSKLADITRAQAQQIAVLRAEVNKLRLKNYPSLPAPNQRHRV